MDRRRERVMDKDGYGGVGRRGACREAEETPAQTHKYRAPVFLISTRSHLPHLHEVDGEGN